MRYARRDRTTRSLKHEASGDWTHRAQEKAGKETCAMPGEIGLQDLLSMKPQETGPIELKRKRKPRGEGETRQRLPAFLPQHVAADFDEVIRKRLLIDGDGAGDDRRINLLVKSFIKWCNSGSQEEGYSQYQRMLSTLSQCEFSMGKTLLVYDMNLREMENYEKIYKEIECSIAGAHEKIAECKKQILQAKRIRKNRQEYDALAKVIQHHPDRHETLKELEALGKELEHLSHIKESVEDKLELRRKQFHVLLSTIHELQQTLENDEKLSEVEEAQETSMETNPKP
ncbi:THO complex subunit 7 isoform X1 [Dasypus novemcinctus]|nr:THO complex subunit 7 homolog isoform X1 [Dasypus novemcinctus]